MNNMHFSKLSCWLLLHFLVFFSGLRDGGSASAAGTLRRADEEEDGFIFDLFWEQDPPPGASSTTKLVLDALSKLPPGLFRDVRAVPVRVWERIYACFEQESTDDLNLLDVSEASYRGLLELALTEGSWGQMSTGFIEDNPTPLTTNNDTIAGGTAVVIFEPCNTISNFAFYRSMFAICDRTNDGPDWSIGAEEVRALVRGFNLLGYTSVLFHASNTPVGQRFDNLSIDIYGFLVHQALVSAFPDESLLFHLQNTSRTFTGVEAAERLSRILLTENAQDWNDLSLVINNDIPTYTASFSGIGLTLFYTTLPSDWADALSRLLLDILVRNEDDRRFILEGVKPAVQEALMKNDVNVSILDKIKLLSGGIGVLIKLVSPSSHLAEVVPCPCLSNMTRCSSLIFQAKAFFWQEEFLDRSIYNIPLINSLGALLMPEISKLANKLTGYDRSSDLEFQYSLEVYPGGFDCNAHVPHAKWHQMAANMLVDLSFLANDAFRVLTGGTLLFRDFQADFVECLAENECLAGFEISGVQDLSADPAVEPLWHCFETTISSAWPLGAFGDCVLDAFTSTNTSSVSEDREGTPSLDTIDGCLLARECLVFENGFVNVEQLQHCIKNGQRSECGSYLTADQATQLDSCIPNCDGGALCTAGCFHLAGIEFSASFDIMSTCLNAFFVDPATEPEQAAIFQEACRQWADNRDSTLPVTDAGLSPPATIADVVTQGLPPLVTCATTQCQSSYWNSSFRRALSCAAECMTTDPTALCALGCLIDNIE